MSQVITRKPLRGKHASAVNIIGSFAVGSYPVTATATLAVASSSGSGSSDITLTSDTEGADGNSLYYQATNDGNQKASIDLSSIVPHDVTIQAKAAGVAYNDWKLILTPGSGTGESVNCYEDETNKTLIIMFEDGVDTEYTLLTQIDAQCSLFEVSNRPLEYDYALTIGRSEVFEADFSGGTAATYVVVEEGSEIVTHLHYTSGTTTVAAAVAAFNAPSSGTKVLTAAGSGSNTLEDVDVDAKTVLSGGITSAATTVEKGRGLSIAHSAIGTYTLTLDNFYADLISHDATFQSATADNPYHVIVGPYTADSKTIVLYVWDSDNAALVDPTTGAGERINYNLAFALR